jgi:CubicO group peptidase (beta-lactamase class C family)
MTMICRRFLPCVLALCLTSRAAAQRPDFAAFDKRVEREVRDWRAPGLAIAVVKGDSAVFVKGYGVIELGRPAPVDVHTRFAIGSTTKAMTSAAIAMLVDEGKLRWDDRVIDFIPELHLYDAYATRELTIRDLLTHRSGLPATDLFWQIAENTPSPAEQIRRLRYIRPASSFRSRFAYQNVMYTLNGTIIQRVSGMPWDAFIRSRIFAPLGMTESEALVSAIVGRPNVAAPHLAVGDGVRVIPVKSTDAVAPGGSVWSSVSDMSRWMRFVLDSGRVGGKRLISPGSFRELVTPQIRVPLSQYAPLQLSAPRSFSYGLGWFVQDYQGREVLMHTGSIDGMSALVGLIPGERLGVVVLGNLDHLELRHALMYEVFDLYGRAPPRDWSTELKTLFAARSESPGSAPQVTANAPASLPLKRYAGTYVDSAYGTIAITVGNGVLRARYGHLDMGALEHWSFDSFRARARTAIDDPPLLVFQSDGAGGVASLSVFDVVFLRSAAR